MPRHAVNIALAIVLFATSLATTARAQNSQTFGDTLVHYNAIPTLALGEAMAKRYAITRSARAGLLNIAVQKTRDDGSTQALAATISGDAVNLTGQRTTIAFREIAGEEVSYIGVFDANGPDTYTFNLSIRPNGSTQALNVRFNQNFPAE
ncbi:MAG: DUF4426 domain-containing protein [Dokdonella sp.]